MQNSILNEIMDQIFPLEQNTVSVTVRGVSFSFAPEVSNRAVVWRGSKVPLDYGGTYGVIEGQSAPTLAVSTRSVNGKDPHVIFAKELEAFTKILDANLRVRSDLTEVQRQEYRAYAVEEHVWECLLRWYSDMPNEALSAIYDAYLSTVRRPWQEQVAGFFGSSMVSAPDPGLRSTETS